jgi:hypothetical protein
MKITSYIAAGETRKKPLEAAMKGDGRFLPLVERADLPVDLQFIGGKDEYEYMGEPICDYKVLNIELKKPDDFVQSVLNGHLMDQVLSIREGGNNGCTVILGTLDEIYEAIKESAKLRKGKFLRGDESRKAIAETHLRCKSFRKRSMLNGVPVFHKGDDSGFFDSDDQFKDILELAHDYLLDGDMLGFRQRPAEHERELCAAATLFKGLGPETWRNILVDYQIGLVPRGDYARPIEELPGIGKKRAAQISPLIRMVYANRVRA